MIRDENGHPRDLAIVEKYGAVVSYLYPILQAMPRRHGDLRAHMIGLLCDTVGLLYHAAKSRQVSRLHAADAQLATLRYWLQFATDRRCISYHQHRTALGHIAEVGAMLGAWIKLAKSNGRSGT
ncbi:diversity-generating retroelement protein Avd [Shinella pollutisoli]|uniref:Diversity-generating retroelement protein Avd n=1 Tax=Shinella pollutisoli TaxID=2250594 RepID=A0ABV7DAC1_9HYPH|nr:diversity-generating retroelement protein Avd [Shinella pollutisoli]